MAAVTVDTGWPRTNVSGSMREILYRVDIAADEDTLQIPLHVVVDAQCNDDTIQAVGIASITRSGYGSSVVFNTGGAINNCYCRFLGW